jgi:probable HAF family extracellular repeat protein
MPRVLFTFRSHQAPPRGKAAGALVRGLLLSTIGIAALGCAEDPVAPTDPATPAHPDGAVTVAATYMIKDLGTLGGAYSEAKAINNVGRVVGLSDLTSGKRHAFLWHAGVMEDLGALGGGLSQALAINDSGVVVGSSTMSSGAWRAVRWKKGVKTNLGTLGGRNSEATGINLAGVIVGWSETSSGKRHAFIWRNGVMTDLGALAGGYSQASGINRYGRVVGWSSASSGRNHAVAWKNGVLQDLGTHGRISSVAAAINDKGQIAGTLGPRLDAEGAELEESTPFLFYQGTWTVFGTGQLSSEARAINVGGIIVGQDEDPRDDFANAEAWLRENGVVQQLPELIDGHSGANGVNQYGTIVGLGKKTSNGQSHAVLWRRQ